MEASEFEMILDAAIEAKLETKLLEEWYCRDENSVPAAYYLRPKSEMLKSNKNAVSYLSPQSMYLSITLNCYIIQECFSPQKRHSRQSYSALGPKFLFNNDIQN